MNTTRRGRSALALVAASALVFAACGSDDDSGDGGDTGDTGGETTDAPDTTDDTTDTTDDAGEGDGGATAEGIAYGNAQEFSNYNNNLGTSNSVKNSIVLNQVQPNPYNFAGPTGALAARHRAHGLRRDRQRRPADHRVRRQRRRGVVRRRADRL